MNINNGTDTSIEAAKAVESATQAMKKQVYQFLVAQGDKGATNEQISEHLSMKIQTVCPRVYELRQDGHVKDSGERRETKAGIKAKVWKPVLEALTAASV